MQPWWAWPHAHRRLPPPKGNPSFPVASSTLEYYLSRERREFPLPGSTPDWPPASLRLTTNRAGHRPRAAALREESLGDGSRGFEDSCAAACHNQIAWDNS